MRAVWRIELLGGLTARLGERTVTRFRTQKTAALFAYLAYHRHRSHPRETLIELFWPEAEPESSRHSLSLALSSLRNQLEPPGVEPGGVVVADRWSVELNPDAFTTDVGDFETALRLSAQAHDESGKIRHLSEAVEQYKGRLLPGSYEDWVLLEQDRLVERNFQALRQLTELLTRNGEGQRAIDAARRATQVDPLREEAHLALIQLLADAGQPAAALRQYREFERMLAQDLEEEPSRSARELVRRIEAQHERGEVNEDRSARPSPRGELTAPVRAAAPPALPAGTVTFLLTDIEGSTARWEREGESFRDALSTHHTLLRREFQRHAGYEVQEGGDSFLVAFASASDGLACAVAAQRALETQEWADCEPVRVRMALHSGDVELRDGQYRGLVLHRASRIMSAAHGGQVLCSEATSSLLRRDLETEVQLRDLGVYRLRDVEQPERLFQVEFAGMARREFPSLRAERAHSGNLPLQFTRFFGREKELAELEVLLTDASIRLVTMTGPGGTGKSRLSVEAAGRLVDAYAGRVWFVPLAALSDPHLIPSAVLHAMGGEPGDRDPLAGVITMLSGRRSLLLLDNFEQLVPPLDDVPGDGGPEIVQSLLERVPGLVCLVTSRHLLGLQGEREFAVPPLPIPGDGGTPDGMGIFESVRLFVDRAQAVKPDFQVTNSNAPAVAELCNRLEGIPLAIELAAARAQVLSPAQMLQQLGGGPGGRFDLLVTRRRGIVERQRALRSTVDWSYRLLSPPLQEFFRRLSVFRGGWSTEAAEAVCNVGAPALVGPALDHLAQLRESSLVMTEEGPDGIRFRMLETLRDFASEKLVETDVAETQARHVLYYLNLAELGEHELRGERQAEWLNRLQCEHDNFRTAVNGCLTRGDTEGRREDRVHRAGLGARFCTALWYYWSIRGHMTEGRRVAAQVLAALPGDAAPSDRAGVLLASGVLAHDQSDFEAAEEALRECVALRRSAGDDAGLAHALNCLANVLLDSDRADDAMALYQEALGLYREAGDARGASIALSNLGVVHQQRGELERAAELLGQSVRLKRKLGNLYGLANSLDSLGNVERALGRVAEARVHYDEALALRRELGHKQGIGISLNNLGALLLEAGELREAESQFREALALFEELGEPRGLEEARAGLDRSLAELDAVEA